VDPPERPVTKKDRSSWARVRKKETSPFLEKKIRVVKTEVGGDGKDSLSRGMEHQLTVFMGGEKVTNLRTVH